MATRLGFDCILMYNDGTFATPDWTPVEAVQNASLNIAVATADASRRGGNGWRANVATLKEATIEATIIVDPDDDGYLAILADFKAGTPMELAALDGPNAAGTEYLLGMWTVSQWNRTEDLEGVVTIEATFTAAQSDDLPNPVFGTGALPTTRV